MRLKKSTEAAAWQAAAPLLDLPDDLARMFATLEQVTDEQRQLATQPADTQAAASAIVAGMSAAEALEAGARQRLAQQATEDYRQALAEAVDLLSRNIRKYLADRRDVLIEGPLRDAVAARLDAAAPLADTLAPYAPTFDEATILDAATSQQVKAWQTSRPVNDEWHLLLNAWTRSWMAATASAGGRRIPASLRPRGPAGLHAWTRPHGVADEATRDGWRVDVLAIATYRDAGGFRLASGPEVVALVDQLDTIETNRSLLPA